MYSEFFEYSRDFSSIIKIYLKIYSDMSSNELLFYRNTAALVHHMVRQGCKLQPTSGEGPKTNQLRETPTEDVEINGSPRGRPEVSERKRSRRPFYGKQIYQKENLDNVKISIPKFHYAAFFCAS